MLLKYAEEFFFCVLRSVGLEAMYPLVVILQLPATYHLADAHPLAAA